MTNEYDVLVVGSGAGALTAAVLAARAGLRTAVLEKSALLGGTSAYSGAACWLPGSQVQQRAGVADSTESARTYLTSLLGDHEAERREAFLATAPRVVAALEEDPALRFEWRPFPDYFDRPGRVPRGRSFVPCDLPRDEIGRLADLVRPSVDRDRAGLGHPDGPLTQGRALVGRLLLALHRTGLADVVTGADVDTLVRAGGRVGGVEAVVGGERRRYAARLGVVLGSGGFERNAAARARHGVPGAADWTMAPAGTNTGAAIDAAVRLGAATGLLDEAWWCPGVAMPDGSASFTLGLRGGVVVDGRGRRYANESLPYDQFGRQMAADPARVPSYLVFDARSDARLPAISLPGGTAEEHLAAGTWVRADSLRELADRLEVPADDLLATVARFNALVAAGEDVDFGRGRDEYDRYFADPALLPVERPPFTAARLVLSDLGTKGGLLTDTEGRVLDEEGRPLAGLYAVGNASASLTGRVYPGPGAPIGTAMAFAMRAVEDLAP
ncbi:FAD-dependent oxidoreductase [Nocardioides sp. YIM 152315]|uniref:FAD-dependent oxidoreductase n=1 Tax=Nocardioides sp. YIM 152315 TaxID=3031760 RepID=UPI0023DBD562|nr:FAD-dependent oxidoreductase [Nocardioides sp. YIM 152315]MDF1604123.1 FAD-dependent oxidoreductase [Nocardioides sp. YIM 152315]